MHDTCTVLVVTMTTSAMVLIWCLCLLRTSVVVSLSPNLIPDASEAYLYLYLRPSKLGLKYFPSSGRGIETLVERSPDTVLLEIPVNETVSTRTGTFSLQDNVGNFYSHGQFSEEQKLALILLRLKRNEHPYVCTVLPKRYFGIWTLSEEAWQSRPFSLLPRCYRESFQATRDTGLHFASSIKEYTMDEILWAMSMVRSRSIAVPELAEFDGHLPLALIPGIDLFNHGFHAGTFLQLSENNYWTLTSSQSHKVGDQIFLSYGDDKDNWKLLLTYGFAVTNNPNKLAFWTWEDLLDAAGTVRPSMFSDRVRRSLLQHPQLRIYVSSTEDRATFSLDMKTKLPRESLKNGLTMLSSLASQLGFPDDDKLPQDVLACLVENRIQQLTACLEEFEMPTSLGEDWLSFLNSIELTLKDELSLLAAYL